MSLRISATRYARALFDVALQEKVDLDRVAKDLDEVTALIKENAALLRVAVASGLPDAQRRTLIETVADKLGVTTPVKKLLVVLTNARKLNLLPDLSEVFRERLLAHQNIVRADVTSAAPLSPDRLQALKDSLAKVTGKKVELSAAIDPEILGGVVARIGSTVYDGSVKTQLERLRKELVEQ